MRIWQFLILYPIVILLIFTSSTYKLEDYFTSMEVSQSRTDMCRSVEVFTKWYVENQDSSYKSPMREECPNLM